MCQRGEGERGVSGTPARIPSRLGEPGSLFSRYKFLQLRLVVVMLLTRTRRELLKRRTIGAYTSAASLNQRVTRYPLRHRHRSRYTPVVVRFFSSASFINPGMRTSPRSFGILWSCYLKDKYSQCLRVICIPACIPLEVSLL